MSERPKYQVKIPDYEYYRKMVKCQEACPVHTPSGSYVSAIADGDYERSYTLARGPNSFVAICAWVCNHPCEAACRRGAIDKPVAIRALKRFAVEEFLKRHNDNYHDESLKLSTARGASKGINVGSKVAVIGSGPAGMSAAHDLARLGYRVTIFESLPVLGGMFYVGIPAYRLPRDIIKLDIDAIMKLGVEVRTNTTIGKDLMIADLKEMGFKAIVVAVGAQLSRSLPIEGVELAGVLKGISFLKDIYLGANVKLGERVLVIGGGNVAMDVARTAVRLRPKEVRVACLEARHEMPADRLEIEEALEEGIIIHNRVGPKKIIGNNGQVKGLQCLAVASVFDSQGRFNPTFIEDQESIFETDTIIITVGQASDTTWAKGVDELKFTRWGTLVITPDTFETNIPGIFAAGDVATGPGIAIAAVASGQKVARSVDEYLKGRKLKKDVKARMKVIKSHRMHEGYEDIPLKPVPIIAPEIRIHNFNGIEIGYPEDMAVEQGKRCLRCHINTIFDGDKCILCGGCVDVCPEYCLKMIKVEDIAGDESLERLLKERYGDSLSEGTAMIKDEDRCIRCGLCARRCPTGAITMEAFEFEEVES